MFGLPNASPFCLKLEAFLRWQRIPFTIKHALPFEGPYKKVPFIGYQDQILGDSSHIIETLMRDKKITYAAHLDLASGRAFLHLVEQHLYWALVYFRWQDDAAWPTLRDAFFGHIPFFVRPFIIASARKQATRALYGQGIGRLPKAMIIEKATADLAAINSRLQQQPYICGDQLTHFDLAIWAILKQLIECDLKIQLTEVAQSFTELKRYVERINQQLAPNWQTDEITTESFSLQGNEVG
jgi:glutathione S-transferase